MKKIILLLLLFVPLIASSQLIFKNGQTTLRVDSISVKGDTLYLKNKTTGATCKAVVVSGGIKMPKYFMQLASDTTGMTDLQLPSALWVKKYVAAYGGSGSVSQWTTTGAGITYKQPTGGDSVVIWKDGTLHMYKLGAEVLYTTTKGVIGQKYNTLYNTAIGDSSLNRLTNGANNAATGYKSMFSLTHGDYNTAIGDESMLSSTTSNYNTASGRRALWSNTTGSENTGIGASSLLLNVSSSYNTASGAFSLYNSTGGYNTAFGHSALFNNTSGTRNIAIGYYAGRYNTNQSNRFYLNCLDQTNILGDTTKSLIFGYQDSNPIYSRLKFNANTYITGIISQTQLSCAITDDTPTATEIVSCAGSASTAGAGTQRTVKDSNGTGKLYRIESDGTDWYYTVMVKSL